MKRFHVHVHVENLEANIGFYTRMFGAGPSRVESDYAKWMLDDPPVNFAISSRGGRPGIDHLGIQTDDPGELDAMKRRAQAADPALHDEGETTCCYARTEKHWVTDPQGITWEAFHTHENIAVFNERTSAPAGAVAACCTPAAPRGRPRGVPIKAGSSCC